VDNPFHNAAGKKVAQGNLINTLKKTVEN